MSAMAITEFIEARLAEWEQAARHIGGEWHRTGINSIEDSDGRPVIHGDGPWPNGSQADHIALNDPARVLAQVAAMRAIVELHSVDGMRDCPLCLDAAYPEGVIMEAWPCQTLGHLAAVWSSHDDYDPAWAPESG